MTSRYASRLSKFAVTPKIDLTDWVGQRSATFRFQLLDGVTGQNLGNITPLRDSAPTLSHNVERTIPRTLTLELGVRDTERVNQVRARVVPYLVIDGVGEFPLGRYMIGDRTRVISSGGAQSSLSLTDEMWIADQELDDAFSAGIATEDFQTGEPADRAIRRLIRDLPLRQLIESSNYYAIGSWPPGTMRGQILSELAIEGGYYSPWCDNHGVLRMIQLFEPRNVLPTIDLDRGNQVISDSILLGDTLLTAPNRYIVISNGTTNTTQSRAPIVGVYDIPSSAPHSIENRGFVISKTFERQNVTAPSAAATARNIALSSNVFETVTLATPPNPYHDGYDVVRWDDKLWLETAWSMLLTEGGNMTHTLRRIYE